MRPIKVIRAKTMSRKLRKWLVARLESAGFTVVPERLAKTERRRWHGPGKWWMRGDDVYRSLLSAARAAGVHEVPVI